MEDIGSGFFLGCFYPRTKLRGVTYQKTAIFSDRCDQKHNKGEVSKAMGLMCARLSGIEIRLQKLANDKINTTPIIILVLFYYYFCTCLFTKLTTTKGEGGWGCHVSAKLASYGFECYHPSVPKSWLQTENVSGNKRDYMWQ
jgi:hypothetical protein